MVACLCGMLLSFGGGVGGHISPISYFDPVEERVLGGSSNLLLQRSQLGSSTPACPGPRGCRLSGEGHTCRDRTPRPYRPSPSWASEGSGVTSAPLLSTLRSERRMCCFPHGGRKAAPMRSQLSPVGSCLSKKLGVEGDTRLLCFHLSPKGFNRTHSATSNRPVRVNTLSLTN